MKKETMLTSHEIKESNAKETYVFFTAILYHYYEK